MEGLRTSFLICQTKIREALLVLVNDRGRVRVRVVSSDVAMLDLHANPGVRLKVSNVDRSENVGWDREAREETAKEEWALRCLSSAAVHRRGAMTDDDAGMFSGQVGTTVVQGIDEATGAA